MGRFLKTTTRSILKRATKIVAALLVTVSAADLGAATPGEEKISRDLRSQTGTALIDVIVQFRRAPQKAEIEGVVAKGASLRRSFRHVPAAVFRMPLQALQAVASQSQVLYVSPDRIVEGKLEFAAPTVGADLAFSSGWTGSGIGIAVLDSGVNPEHPDIRGRIVKSENFVPNETTTDDPYGHGTHVAVAMAGNAAASSGNSYVVTFRGIAPGAHLANFRVLNQTGQGTDSAVIAAIDRAIELRALYNIRVLNLSLGRRIMEHYTLDPLCSAVERAWNAGIVVVAAAGNNGRDNSMGTSGYGTISSPGNSPHVITVGAMKDMATVTRADDLMASYSSKGPTLLDHIVKPDLVAPGNLVVAGVSTNASLRTLMPENIVPVSYYRVSSSLNTSTMYFRLSGTSVAAPMVAGAVALLLQKTPTLTPDQVKARLMKSATKNFPVTSFSADPITGETYHVTYDLFTVGAGYLDIAAALANTDLSSGAATSPRAVFDPSDGSTTLVIAPDSVWSNAVIWGSAVVWGSNVVVNGDAVVWGSAVMWGSHTSAGFAVIWGSDTSSSSTPFPLAVSANGER
jgi:serine protease AprX